MKRHSAKNVVRLRKGFTVCTMWALEIFVINIAVCIRR